MKFYNKYFNLYRSEAVLFKDNYIRNSLQDDYLYKFISFDNNCQFNNAKLDCLANNAVWASYYRFFEDTSELKVPFNPMKVARKTNRSINNVIFLFNTLREIYDICCFTNRIDEYMWENYANKHNGICLCFHIIDSDKFFPIEYIQKNSFDLSDSIIKTINSSDSGNLSISNRSSLKVSTLPLTLKDVKYKEESEIRVLYSPFDDENGVFSEIIRPNIKEEMNYIGCQLRYSDIDLALKKVIIAQRVIRKSY